ncbi:uncharacterized protein LOC115452283 isoform X2 [Manduca sexta]|uniref:Uncharacterized protein n=2 Tax=Manduca sexta TaxID=7130 RepID=A0A922CYH2_MANSE|nr:uncharacterized protein LOC115452283 isoform X2 [Manduca sexta]KAG6463294.1 hypothetical protein O3G_MSEX013793 [Manduca sexta]
MICADKDCESTCNHTITNVNEVKRDKMKEALNAIAQEILLFQNPNNTVSNANIIDDEDIINKLIKSKSSLAFKRKMIKKLKEKVKTACIAQAAISAGENESTSLNGHLHLARNEYADLYQKYRQTSQIIQTTTRDNKALREELDNLFDFIKLGYNELQKINNKCLPDISVTQQLKQIIICCGQYYADYNNEREINLQLSQKNRFLNNKINILNNSLEAVTEDLKNLRCQNARLQKENNSHRERNENYKAKYVVPISLACHKKYQKNFHMSSKIKFIRKSPDLDVTVHLSIIKKLLRDQDNLLRSLTSLSKEIISD